MPKITVTIDDSTTIDLPALMQVWDEGDSVGDSCVKLILYYDSSRGFWVDETEENWDYARPIPTPKKRPLTQREFMGLGVQYISHPDCVTWFSPTALNSNDVFIDTPGDEYISYKDLMDYDAINYKGEKVQLWKEE